MAQALLPVHNFNIQQVCDGLRQTASDILFSCDSQGGVESGTGKSACATQSYDFLGANLSTMPAPSRIVRI